MTTLVYTGRPVFSGTATGRAEVSSIPFDTCASYVDVLISGARSGLCRDPANEDLYEHDLIGSILCIPQTIGSSSATTLWMTLVEHGLAPKGLCLANPIDATAAKHAFVGSVDDHVNVLVEEIAFDDGAVHGELATPSRPQQRPA